MKKVVKRTSAFLVVVSFAILIFVLFLFIGDKSKGPLEDLARIMDNSVAKFEKKMVGGNIREMRSASLKWFDRYRNNKVLINYPDTIFLGAYDNNTAESYESIVALEDSLKTNLPIIQLYTAWGSKKEQVFPLLRAQAIYDLGSIPMITWEPWLNDFDTEKYPVNPSLDNVNRGGMKAVANGKYDGYIDSWAIDARDFNAPIFLRFGHEMNDPYRYPWGPQYNKPQDYIAAWKHITDRFRKIGANNVIWIWSPHPAYLTYEQYYPGNDYVDWIGIGALNYGTVETWSKWWSFDEIIRGFYTTVSHYEKPMMISEFGSLEVGGDRIKWYKEALDSLPFKYPVVKAVIFFNNSNDNTTSYKVFDWSITKDQQVIATIRQAIIKWKMIKTKK
ncbi:MAG: glycoside hydrolase family 26 protein [Chitinophagaceae bacterium]